MNGVSSLMGSVFTSPAFVGVPLTRERYDVVEEVLQERHAQDVKWGQQDHPDGTGPDGSLLADIGALWNDTTNADLAEYARDRCNALSNVPGRVTYAHIFLEEVGEALAESDPEKLRTELLQVAAVAVAWVEAIDRREVV